MPRNPLSNYIERQELADILGRSVRTLVRWENRRIGPPVTRIGSKVLYRTQAVEAWLRRRESDPEAEQ